MAAFVAIKTARDTVFFGQGDLRQLPLVYLLIAGVAIPAAMMHLGAMRRWGVRRVRSGTFVAMALLFLGLAPFVGLEHRTAAVVLFAVVPAAFAAVFASGWLLAGDLFEGAGPETVRWLYSRIGVGSVLGGVIGGTFASVLATVVEPSFLVAAGGLMILAAAGVVSRAHRWHPVQSSVPPGTDLSEEDPVGDVIQGEERVSSLGLLRNPYVQGVVAISASGALAALYIDFQFYAAVTLSGSADARFFANFHLMLNLASLALLLFVAPRVQRRHGLGGALLVLPLSLLAGMGVTALGGLVFSRSMLKVTEAGMKASIHRFSWEQVFLPLGGGRREAAKVLADGLAARIAEVIGALVLVLWLSLGAGLDSGLNFSWISWVIGGTIVLWIALTRSLARNSGAQGDEVEYMLPIPDS